MPRTPKEYRRRYTRQVVTHMESSLKRLEKLEHSLVIPDENFLYALAQAREDIHKVISAMDIVHSCITRLPRDR